MTHIHLPLKDVLQRENYSDIYSDIIRDALQTEMYAVAGWSLPDRRKRDIKANTISTTPKSVFSHRMHIEENRLVTGTSWDMTQFCAQLCSSQGIFLPHVVPGLLDFLVIDHTGVAPTATLKYSNLDQVDKIMLPRL